jgi:peptide/nickel transport system permease protein
VKDFRIIFGAAVAIAVIMVAMLAPYIAPCDPAEQSLCAGLSKPCAGHWLGQDKLGRDQLSRLIYGARVSVIVGLSTVLISASVGIFIGAIAGFFRGIVDQVLMRVVDILLAFPGILLAIALTAVLGPSLRNIILALSILGWVGYARLVRGQVLVEREKDYVQAAVALGAGSSRIILRHLLINTSGPVIVQATFGIALAILAEASLSFLGLGAPGMPSWGAMLNDGTSFLLTAPFLSIFPGLAIMITVLGFNFLGDGLRKALSPREDISRI